MVNRVWVYPAQAEGNPGCDLVEDAAEVRRNVCFYQRSLHRQDAAGYVEAHPGWRYITGIGHHPADGHGVTHMCIRHQSRGHRVTGTLAGSYLGQRALVRIAPHAYAVDQPIPHSLL